MAQLELDKVVKKFGKTSIIHSLDLAVDAGVLATSGWVVHGGVPAARAPATDA